MYIFYVVINGYVVWVEKLFVFYNLYKKVYYNDCDKICCEFVFCVEMD